MSLFYHERLYRSQRLMERIAELPVTICGAGALGANICESLARTGFGRLRVIDRDRIEERNLSTQPYYRSDIGAFKAKILANSLYRALGVAIEAKAVELRDANAEKLLRGSEVVVDTFDNSHSRRLVKATCSEANLACLHAGMAEGYAEVIWNEGYRVPSASQDDVCDYPLARNLAMLATTVTCEVLLAYVATGERRSYTMTLGDLKVVEM